MSTKLIFKNQVIDWYELNILDIIKQLKFLQDVKFTSSTGKSYTDVLANVYNMSKIDEDAVLLLPNFRKALKTMISDDKNVAIFKELGATDLDIALIKGDVEFVKDFVENNNFSDPYNIAKEFRMLSIGVAIATQDDLAPDAFADIKLNIGSDSIGLTEALYYAFNYQKLDHPTKNMLIHIENTGNNGWDYHESLKWHNALAHSFDKVISFGNGTDTILSKHIAKLLNIHKTKDLETPELDFALVMLHTHGDEEGNVLLEEIQQQLPHNIAKETVYFISSCYSGFFHKSWSGNAHLVTSCAVGENGYTGDFNKIVNLLSYFQDNKPSLKGLLQYCEQYELSRPHYTGSVSGIDFRAAPVKDASIFLYSNEHDSLYPDSSTSQANIGHTLVGVTDLLLYDNQ